MLRCIIVLKTSECPEIVVRNRLRILQDVVTVLQWMPMKVVVSREIQNLNTCPNKGSILVLAPKRNNIDDVKQS